LLPGYQDPHVLALGTMVNRTFALAFCRLGDISFFEVTVNELGDREGFGIPYDRLDPIFTVTGFTHFARPVFTA
jgi:hypothetical protein